MNDRPHHQRRLGRTALAGLLIAFLTVSVIGLDTVPEVHQDEPWIAATAWTRVTRGVFGSDLFAGLFGMENHTYAFPPVLPALLAVTFKVSGVGLLPMRLLVVALAGLTLALTYLLGERLFSPQTGVLAAGFLCLVRIFAHTPMQVSGIPLVDFARIGRYDVLVAMFGLIGLLLYTSAHKIHQPVLHVACGASCALAGLSNAYGILWLVAFCALIAANGDGWKSLSWYLLGFLGPVLVYILYVMQSPGDWINQLSLQPERFELLDPKWYAQNFLNEPRRYSSGIGMDAWRMLLRPGLLATLIAFPISLSKLGLVALRQRDFSARTIVIPCLVLPIGLALLVHNKSQNYVLLHLHLMALVVAWGLLQLQHWISEHASLAPLRIGLAGLVLVASVEGALGLARLQRAEESMTSYADFIRGVQYDIDPNAHVLGLHRYWFEFEDHSYRSWFVFLVMGASTNPSEMLAALNHYNPDVVLIDPAMRAYFSEAGALLPVRAAARGWLDENYRMARCLDDPTYGVMEIYRKPQFNRPPLYTTPVLTTEAQAGCVSP